MTYGSSEDTDEGFEIQEAARHLQQTLGNIPNQARLVSKLSKGEANRVARELRKVKPKKITKGMATPRLTPKMPSPRIPRPNSSFETFVGRRRRVKSGLNLLFGD